MSTVKIDFVPHFGAFVIETLTLGMYGESRNEIREYIQNCRDSLLQAIDDKLITSRKPDDIPAFNEALFKALRVDPQAADAGASS